MNRIAIVGGGIAGLALATILDPDRFDVTLYEEQPGRYGLPTALAMWPGASGPCNEWEPRGCSSVPWTWPGRFVP